MDECLIFEGSVVVWNLEELEIQESSKGFTVLRKKFVDIVLMLSIALYSRLFIYSKPTVVFHFYTPIIMTPGMYDGIGI